MFLLQKFSLKLKPLLFLPDFFKLYSANKKCYLFVKLPKIITMKWDDPQVLSHINFCPFHSVFRIFYFVAYCLLE